MRNGFDHVLPDPLDRTGCALLAAGIVRQAVKDWKDADEILQRHPNYADAQEMRLGCEIFFASDWYQELREFAPDAIPVDMLRRLKDDQQGIHEKSI